MFCPPHDDRIWHCNVPPLPHLHFEWHVGSKKLYVIDHRSEPPIAAAIADAEIENQGQAQMCILYYCRGYQDAKRETMLMEMTDAQIQ